VTILSAWLCCRPFCKFSAFALPRNRNWTLPSQSSNNFSFCWRSWCDLSRAQPYVRLPIEPGMAQRTTVCIQESSETWNSQHAPRSSQCAIVDDGNEVCIFLVSDSRGLTVWVCRVERLKTEKPPRQNFAPHYLWKFWFCYLGLRNQNKDNLCRVTFHKNLGFLICNAFCDAFSFETKYRCWVVSHSLTQYKWKIIFVDTCFWFSVIPSPIENGGQWVYTSGWTSWMRTELQTTNGLHVEKIFSNISCRYHRCQSGTWESKSCHYICLSLENDLFLPELIDVLKLAHLHTTIFYFHQSCKPRFTICKKVSKVDETQQKILALNISVVGFLFGKSFRNSLLLNWSGFPPRAQLMETILADANDPKMTFHRAVSVLERFES